MALNIKNDEAEHAIRELASITGESLTDAILIAAQERLARVRRERDRATVIADVRRMTAEIRARIGPGVRDDHEDLYDPVTGLPA